jgi:hypothetical protein
VKCLCIKARGLNADESVYASLEPISHDLPHKEIVALVAKRVEDVDWQAFKTSFDIHTSTLRLGGCTVLNLYEST